MSDNATDVLLIAIVFSCITLTALFHAWRDRGVAKHNALAAQYGARDAHPDSGVDQASVSNSTTNERHSE